MRRALFAFLLFCAPASAADPIAGLTPGRDTATGLKNWTLLQGAIDSAPAGPVDILLPPGRWTILRDLIVERDAVTVRCERPGGATLALSDGRAGPVVVTGYKPSFGGHTLPDADIAAMDTGRLGLAIRKGQWLAVPFQAWSFPGYGSRGIEDWSHTRGFRLSLSLDVGTGLVGDGVILSQSEGGMPRPVSLVYSGGSLRLMVGLEGDPRPRVLAIPDPGWKGTLRLSFAVDTASGVVATVNGVVNAAKLDSPFPAGARLCRNEDSPMLFGGCGPYCGQQSDYYAITDGFRYTLRGAKLSTLAAGAPSSDTTLYSNDTNTIAFLPLDDDPAYVKRSRRIQSGNGFASGGSSRGVGYLIDTATITPYSTVQGMRLERLALESHAVYGQGVMLGFAGDTQLDGLSIAGGVGIGGLGLGANYVTQVTGRTTLAATIYPIHATTGIFDVDGRLAITRFGLAAIRSRSTGITLDRMYVLAAGCANTRRVIDLDESGFEARKVMIDNEDVVDYTEMDAIVRSTLGGNGPIVLDLGRLDFAQAPATASAIRLEAKYTGVGRNYGRLRLGGMSDFPGPMKAVVEVNHADWRGDVVLDAAIPKAPPLLDGTGGTSGVVVKPGKPAAAASRP